MARTKKIKIRSGFEERIRANLDAAGVKYEYESIKLKYTASECPHCGVGLRAATYTPDFVFRDSVGINLVVEAKGRFTAQDRKKMQAVKKAYPTLNIRILLMFDNRIGKSPNGRVRIAERDRKPDKRKTYGEWCTKNGFEWAVGDQIPQSWLQPRSRHSRSWLP